MVSVNRTTQPPLAAAAQPLLAAGCIIAAALFFSCAPVFAKAGQGGAISWLAAFPLQLAALAAGLIYARRVSPWLAMPQVLALHASLMIAAFLYLPASEPALSDYVGAAPALDLFTALALPCFTAAATFGLMQVWMGRANNITDTGFISHGAASCALAGLVTALALIEPWLDADEQAHLWMALFAALGVLFAVTATLIWRMPHSAETGVSHSFTRSGLAMAAAVLAPGALALVIIRDFAF